MDEYPDKEAMQKYRLKHFAVECKEPHGGMLFPNEVCLSVTHTGFQWTSICLSPQEMLAVIKALVAYLKSKEKDIEGNGK